MPIQLSAEQFRSYAQCPRRMLLEEANPPELLKPQEQRLTHFAVKKALFELLRSGGWGRSKLRDLQGALERAWLAGAFSNAEEEAEHRESAREQITRFYSFAHLREAENLVIDEVMTLAIGELALTVPMERLCRHRDGLIELVHYMDDLPGERTPPVGDPAFVFLFLGAAWRHRTERGEKIRATLHYVGSNIISSVDLHTRDFARRLEEVVKVLRPLADSLERRGESPARQALFPVRPSGHCASRSVRHLCQEGGGR